MVRERIRIRFSKTGNLCFIGHRDLLTTLERLFRRSRLPIAMSQGFHPKLRMSFPSALPLGVAGEDEVFELELSETMEPDFVLESLNRCSVDGLRFLSATVLAPGEKNTLLHSSLYEVNIPSEFRQSVQKKIESFLSSETFPIEKHNGKTVDLRPAVLSLDFDSETGPLTVELLTTQGPDAGIREFLKALGLDDEIFRSVFPVRKKCMLQKETAEDRRQTAEKNSVNCRLPSDVFPPHSAGKEVSQTA
ncbi:MAG: TIGR03936 family radical SAM-associated protein [Planctomycetaceae bacterium]|nr:TIGR03936 family radical SAM-associated protein [Planctomycetaceae bacterium]MCL2304394.1 TIGR03936 family radical SAM-associated protein [Planctomycetaceae bacterium]